MSNRALLVICAWFCAVTVGSASQIEPATGIGTSEALTWDDGQGNTLPYRFFSPAGIEPGEEVPLVLFMHGAGERGTDNMAHVSNHILGLVLETQSAEHKSFLLAPQVPEGGTWATFAEEPSSPMRMTLEILDHLIATRAVDTDRIYITGLSMGGFGTFDALWRQPDRFAAAVPMSGGAPTSIAETISHIPLWAFHGQFDTVVPVENTRNIIAALEDAGGDPLYTETTGGHVIWNPIYRDLPTGPTQGGLYDWMFRQSIPEPSMLVLLLVVTPLGARRIRAKRRA